MRRDLIDLAIGDTSGFEHWVLPDARGSPLAGVIILL
jgi:hypothetical protein